jgi:membrane protease YdiL (CAAX protease family)
MSQQVLLLIAAAPLVALAGVRSGLLPHASSIPFWYLLLAAPFWEEALFRGGLQQHLLTRSWGNRPLLMFSLANWLTSICFILAHLPFQAGRSLTVLIPSLVLGWLFERTNRVLPCMLLHSWFNLCWLSAASFSRT